MVLIILTHIAKLLSSILYLKRQNLNEYLFSFSYGWRIFFLKEALYFLYSTNKALKKSFAG